jgi:lipoate---protein ligase
MHCAILASSNPYINLATEEYFLKTSDEEHFLIYINEPCIVVGKHQNLLSEINIPYVVKNKIKLARRISGGGTVYQDFNNLNFSFIHNCPNLDKISFENFTTPVLNALRKMGLNVQFSDRHDILIHEKKISGNAMHVFRTRVLSHGTLLYNADLKNLSNALKNGPQKYHDKSIKSVRSSVTNIASYLTIPLTMEQFCQKLFENIIDQLPMSYIRAISQEETDYIKILSSDKFESWDWIFGYSPKYIFQNSFDLLDRTVNFGLKIENGVIKSVTTDSQPTSIYKHAFELLNNTKHDYYHILEVLQNDKIITNTSSFNITEFCDLLF